MKPYADSNFLVRLMLILPETGDAISLMAHAKQPGGLAFPITWLHRVETSNAFQLHVFQSSRSALGTLITPELAAVAQATFESDLVSGDYLTAAILSVGDVERQFVDLSLRHTARHGFRTYDLLHVASALVLGCDAFWSFDEKACRLAALEGLKLCPKLR